MYSGYVDLKKKNKNINNNIINNINNYDTFCKFGPLVVYEDGSATLGSGDTQITISASGEVKIPSAAITT